MSLHWLERGRIAPDENRGAVTYMEDLASATRFDRFARALSQIAPGERSRFFSTPELGEIYKNAGYTVMGIGENTFDLAIQDPTGFDLPAPLARITLAKSSNKFHHPSQAQIEHDVELIGKFERGLVKQPDTEKDPNARLILYPRIVQLPPTIRFYLGGRALDHKESSFTLSGERYNVLIPDVDPDKLPLANYDQMLETVGQVEALYTKDPESPEDLSVLQSIYPKLSFIDTEGEWDNVPSDRTIIHVGGGSSSHSLMDQLTRSLSNLNDLDVRTADIYYELDGQVVLRFCITHPKPSSRAKKA